jgi:hypothetical protein
MNSEKTCSCHCSDSAVTADQQSIDGPLMRSVFRIPGMDCPAEEQMIRLRLADMPVTSLEFDLPGRHLVVCHSGDASTILKRLVPLGYGAELVESRSIPPSEIAVATESEPTEARTLWVLLTINAVMFVIEMVAGWWGDSVGLISDGVDMFADAAVYGVALYAVGRGARHKVSAAKLAGTLQLLLALTALGEVGRRAFAGSFPEELTMVGISLLALAANISCLTLISRHRQGGVHMRASYIFSANDVLANLGVIVAGVLVALTGSPIPDWMIGTAIGVLVLVGAFRILRLR